jgi:predicted nucleic acid-binding protein
LLRGRSRSFWANPLDASVAVAALRSGESGHRATLRRRVPLFAGRDQIVVPAIFDAEVTSALVRRGATSDRVAAFFERHLTSRRLVNIGPRAVRAAHRQRHTASRGGRALCLGRSA